jgi:5-methyltetrahydropteroyltriglutamate--homocysteine methyltransferase
MIFDDIGSFPLPEGINRNWIERNLDTKEYEEVVQRTFLMKVKAGVECPNYPQFQEMVKQFMSIIKNPELQEDAYLVSKNAAIIKEMKAIEKLSYKGLVRVCVTGPFELYYREFGGIIYDDLLENIAISVSRFVENALKSKLKVHSISVDEPSLGANPELQSTSEQLKLAFEHFKFPVDVQLHLHSYYASVLGVDEIDVLGVEAARDCKILDLIDVEDLDSCDKKLRIGVARSDIDGVIALYNQTYNTNAWKDARLIEDAIMKIESVDVIKDRINKAYKRFGDRIAYIGPDCGLFSYPTQECASLLLSNIRRALDELRC